MLQQEPIGLLVAAVRRRIKQVTTALVKEHKLTPQQFWTIVAIARGGEMSLGELAARRRMDEPTACRVVNTLVHRKLLRNMPDPADRRRSRLVLSASGLALAGRLLPLAATVAEAVEGGLSQGERASLVAGLRKVIANLDHFNARRAAVPPTPKAGS